MKDRGHGQAIGQGEGALTRNICNLIEFGVTSWQAVAAPKGIPKEILAKLHADITKGMRAPDITQRFADQGFELVLNRPEQTSAFFAAEIERWTKVIKASGATVD